MGGGAFDKAVKHALHCAGPDGQSSAEATGEQLTKLLAFHESLSTWAIEGRHAKHKKADGSTQVNASQSTKKSMFSDMP